MKTILASELRTSRPTHWPLRGQVAVWLIILNLGLFVSTGSVRAELIVNPNYPMDTNVSLGVTVKFWLAASTADPPLTFQWQHEGANLPGATNSILWLTNVTTPNAGSYRALIWNAIGESTNSRTATLTVDTTFTKITQGPLVEDREGSVNGAWEDYDNDGRLDVIVANNGDTARQRLYRNLGGNQFARVTNAITTRVGGSWGAQWADLDNDGDLDLYVIYQLAPGGSLARNAMFRNDGGGVFTLMNNAASTTAAFSTDLNWVDHNQDGWVDLYVTTYTWLAGQSTNNFLFQNLADGRFAAWTTNDVGMVLKPRSTTAGPAWCDIDGDGDLDLYVCNYTGGAVNPGVTNYLYRNDGGRMVEVTAGSLPARRSTYASTWADFNNDGLFDLVTGGENATNTLHLNRGNWVFEDVTVASGLSFTGNVYNLAAGDFDNDGDLDLYVPVYDSADALYVNRGDATFDRVNVGSPLIDGSRNSAIWVDYNNDGFLDLFEACGDSVPTLNLLYRNSLKEYGNTNHWLTLRLKGTVSNASAIGARVWARATIGGKQTWQVRQVGGGSLTANSDGLRVHFGLGDATVVDLVRIEWPSGNVQELANQTLNRIMTVSEPIRINPVRPTASLNGSVTLMNAVTGAAYQWLHNGTNLVGQTSKTLTLSNLETVDGGHYGVVVTLSNGTILTNYTYLNIDTQFTKITTGPVVEDKANSYGLHWGDYDDDNNIDLLATNDRGGGSRTVNFLYRNQGDGTFARVTNSLFEGDLGAYGGGAWVDINNDGWLDCYVPDAIRWYSTNATANHLLYLGGPGGNFTKTSANLTGSGMRVAWDTAWGDFDNDGLLDLFAVGAWSSLGTRNCLFYNQGDLAFERVTEGRIVKDPAESEMVAATDYDDDGDLDLLVSSHSQRLLYQNNGDGTFTRITTGPIPQDTGNSAGLAWGDYDNDGKMDLCLATFDERLHLFHNDGACKFTRVLLGPSSNYHIPNWADYDNDGWLDLFVTHGNGSGELRNRLYRNNGDGTFTEVKIGSLPSEGGYSFTCAWADYDNNGFLDLVVANTYQLNSRSFLYRNNGNNNHWLKVKLVGTTSNRSAIGAKVRAQALISGKQIRQTREITGSGSRTQNDPRAHFGLGNTTNITTLRIEWPSGTVQELKNVAADQMLTIIEPRRPVLAVVVNPTQVAGTLTGDTNTVYQMQFADELSAGWTVMTNVTTDATGSAIWSDPGAAPQGRRFYRAVKTP